MSKEEEDSAAAEAALNVEIWKIRKLIKSLDAAQGNGTSMISLVIPADGQISRVTKMLTEELGAANNIKSRVNRQSVIAAITSSMHRLKLYSRLPRNGLVLYCGEVITDGKERMVLIDFEPFKPINVSLYLCHNKFSTTCLQQLIETDSKYGFIIMDGSGCLFATLAGNARDIIHKFSVDLPKKHGRGGQSALRFSRLRNEKRHNYLRKVAELATQLFISNDRVNVAGLVLAGSADFKTELNTSDLFDPRLQQSVVKVVDVSYGGENGFNQAIELSQDALSDIKYVSEKKLIQTYFDHIAHDDGLYCFGVQDTFQALELGAVEKLMLWEGLTVQRIVLRNKSTGEETPLMLTPEQEASQNFFSQKPKSSAESNESSNEVEVVDRQLLSDWLAENYGRYGATLEFITNRSQEGSQFVRGFGGIGGILRYRVGLQEFEDTDESEDSNADNDSDFI